MKSADVTGLPVRTVDWNGITADYTEQDNLLMFELRTAGADVSELETLHALVGLVEARLVA